jgi:hypothetical protein
MRSVQVGTSGGYDAAQPIVKRTVAASAQEAAESVKVPPGGKAEVCAAEDVKVFLRAELAPLKEVTDDD